MQGHAYEEILKNSRMSVWRRLKAAAAAALAVCARRITDQGNIAKPQPQAPLESRPASGYAASCPICGKEKTMSINTEELLQILACPRCLGSLAALRRHGETTGFACAACEVVYPVREAIPIMLVEEAVPRATWDSEHPQDAPDGAERR